jgi:KDO2-lipid IV(A) lauroyltransferase
MKHRLEYLIVRVTIAMVRVLPHWAVRSLGSALGLLVYAVDAPHRRIARENIALAFPTRDPSERRAIARGAFKHFGRLLFELLKFGTLTNDEILRRVEFEGAERPHQAYAQGKGVLFITGHFGSWELHSLAHGLEFDGIGVLARALDNPLLNELLEKIRERTGNFVIYRRGTVRRVMRTLDAGRGVAILIDQHIMSRDAIYVDFFSRPAATTSLVAALALRTGAPVIPVFALPLPGGRYRLIYEHPVEPPPADAPNAIHDFTQRCTDVLEMYVRRNPDQWLWMHRRWRDVRSGEERAADAVAALDAD